MKRLATRVWVECFLYPTEDEEKVEKALQAIAGDLPIRREEYQSFHGPVFWMLRAETGKQSEIRRVIENIVLGLPDPELQELRESIQERIDPEGILHVRIDKQEASKGNVVLGKGGDVIKVRIKLAAYPATRENMIRSAEELFS